MFECPVCGYDKLAKPPVDFSICPCCGTEFGYSDAGPESLAETHAFLRRRWIARGAQWHSRYTAPSPGWNPWIQLIKAKHVGDIPYLRAWLAHAVAFTVVTATSETSEMKVATR